MASKGSVLLWGAKSQARIVSSILLGQGISDQILFDTTLSAPDFPTSARFVGRPEHLRPLLPSCSEAVVCIGGRHGAQRAALSRALRDRFGLAPRHVISPHAVIDEGVELGEGVQILIGACIGIAANIGAFSIVNSNATIDHESRVGEGVHVMGGAAVAGRVNVGDAATIGTNATILPDMSVGAGAQVGAGALIRKNVEENEVVVGVPARYLRTEPPVVDLSVFKAI
jgi:sugar O-acyltransferase (sialic acid O-acetyltransferase NeuD family)